MTSSFCLHDAVVYKHTFHPTQTVPLLIVSAPPLRHFTCMQSKRIPVSDLLLQTVSLQHIKLLAVCTADLFINDTFYVVEFIVLPHVSSDVLLGWDFLSTHDAVVDCARAQLPLFPFSTTLVDTPSPVSKLVFAADAIITLFSATLVFVSSDSVVRSPCLHHLKTVHADVTTYYLLPLLPLC